MPLYTERLLLRKMYPDDAQDAFDLNSDPDVIQYTGDASFASVQEAREFLVQYDAYEKWGYGRLNCYLKESGEYIGWCGLKYLAEEGHTDLGYRLKKKFWNQGYATEGSEVCLQYGFETLSLPFIVATIMKDNKGSIRVAEKLGMKYWKEQDLHGQRGVYFKLTREEYISLRPKH